MFGGGALEAKKAAQITCPAHAVSGATSRHALKLIAMKAPLSLALSFLLACSLTGQDSCRYEVQVSQDIPYAANLTVLTGTPVEEELLMDVYEPVDLAGNLRPVAICLHSGYFLPGYFNGQPFGNRRDSAVAESCRRFAEQGYLAIAPTHRLGWLPLADDYETRFATYLQAQYRAVQDIRSCIRFLRKTAAEQGNPYRLDPERLIVLGFGSGAITALNTAYLRRYEELLLPQFINPEVLVPFIDTTVLGNPYGATSHPLCLANHPGYSSDISMVVNVGGAIGDSSWIGNEPPGSYEPPLVSFHVITDPYIPFTNCFPILQHPWVYIHNVFGSRLAQERANLQGLNEVLADALNDTSSLARRLNQYAASLADEAFLYPGCQSSTYATAHLYPFVPPNEEGQSWLRPESNPWDWWSKPQLDLATAMANAMYGTSFDPDELHSRGLLANPDMSPEKGRAYLDTIFAFLGPRLETLGENGNAPCLTSGTENFPQAQQALSAYPNPAADFAMIQAEGAVVIREIRAYDLLGRQALAEKNIDARAYRLQRTSLAKGIYLIRARLDEGWGVVKVVFY